MHAECVPHSTSDAVAVEVKWVGTLQRDRSPSLYPQPPLSSRSTLGESSFPYFPETGAIRAIRRLTTPSHFLYFLNSARMMNVIYWSPRHRSEHND